MVRHIFNNKFDSIKFLQIRFKSKHIFQLLNPCNILLARRTEHLAGGVCDRHSGRRHPSGRRRRFGLRRISDRGRKGLDRCHREQR